MLKRFVRNMFTYTPSKFLPALTSLLTTPILTRLFLPVSMPTGHLLVVFRNFYLLSRVYELKLVRYGYFAYKAKAELSVLLLV